MSTRVNFQEADHATVKAIIAAISLSTMRTAAGQGWLGWYDVAAKVVPEPQPTGKASAPTIWGRWGIFYLGKIAGSFDRDDAPVRQGYVQLSLYYEEGAQRGCVLGAFTAGRQAFDNATTQTDAFFVEGDPGLRLPQQSWLNEVLNIHFILTT